MNNGNTLLKLNLFSPLYADDLQLMLNSKILCVAGWLMERDFLCFAQGFICHFLFAQKVTKKGPENQYPAWFSDGALI